MTAFLAILLLMAVLGGFFTRIASAIFSTVLFVVAAIVAVTLLFRLFS